MAESRDFIILYPRCPGYMLTLHNLQTIRKEYDSFSRKMTTAEVMKLADKNFKTDFTTMPNDSRKNVYNE